MVLYDGLSQDCVGPFRRCIVQKARPFVLQVKRVLRATAKYLDYLVKRESRSRLHGYDITAVLQRAAQQLGPATLIFLRREVGPGSHEKQENFQLKTHLAVHPTVHNIL